MRHQGRLTEWNDDRGFGFVTPLDGGARVFVHVSEFPRDKRRPLATDLVTYTAGRDDQGRPCAQEVLFLTPVHSAGAPRVASSAAGRPRRVPAIVVILLVLLVVSLLMTPFIGAVRGVSEKLPLSVSAVSANDAISSAFLEQRSGVQVSGAGTVERVLPDDTNGSRHQRFVLRLDSGRTLLVAHNIDLAPRIEALAAGDAVSFFGVYEWNAEGGVVHWTHHDPDGQHVAGWLKHGGRTFQ